MATKKKSAGCKWAYVVIPALILVLFVFLAFVSYKYGILESKLWDYLLDEWMYQSAGICLLVFDILFALYFLALLFVPDKVRAKLAWVTRGMLCATAVVNIVLASYISAELAWENLTFAGVVSYLTWFATGAYALVLLVLDLVRTFKK